MLNGFAVVWSLVCDACFRPGRPLGFVTWAYQSIVFPFYVWGWATDSDYFYTVDQGIGKGSYESYVPADSALIRACAFANIDSVWFALPYMVLFVYLISKSNWIQNGNNLFLLFCVPMLRHLFTNTVLGTVVSDTMNAWYFTNRFVLEVVYASFFVSVTVIWSFTCAFVGLPQEVCEGHINSTTIQS